MQPSASFAAKQEKTDVLHKITELVLELRAGQYAAEQEAARYKRIAESKARALLGAATVASVAVFGLISVVILWLRATQAVACK